jgi:hypothetical protein
LGFKSRKLSIKPSILENSTTPEPPPIVGLLNVNDPGGFWGEVIRRAQMSLYDDAVTTLSEGTWWLSDGSVVTVPKGETRQYRLNKKAPPS